MIKDWLATHTRRGLLFQKVRTVGRNKRTCKSIWSMDKTSNLECLNYKGQRNREGNLRWCKEQAEAREMSRYGQH